MLWGATERWNGIVFLFTFCLLVYFSPVLFFMMIVFIIFIVLIIIECGN